jgi:hypothetical protein
VGNVDESGVYTNTFTTYTMAGYIRAKVRSPIPLYI